MKRLLITAGILAAGFFALGVTVSQTPFGGVPLGGTTGQVLMKTTDTNYDATWSAYNGFRYSKTLTNDNNPVAIFEVAIASNSYAGGSVEAVIECTDGTNYQTHVTTFKWAAVNKAGTISSTPNDYNEYTHSSSGTLADVWTITDGAGKITINVAATSSLTETSKVIKFTINNPHGNVITLL